MFPENPDVSLFYLLSTLFFLCCGIWKYPRHLSFRPRVVEDASLKITYFLWFMWSPYHWECLKGTIRRPRMVMFFLHFLACIGKNKVHIFLQYDERWFPGIWLHVPEAPSPAQGAFVPSAGPQGGTSLPPVASAIPEWVGTRWYTFSGSPLLAEELHDAHWI